MTGLSLLLWKNCVLLKRKWILTIVEVLLPCLAVIVMVILRQTSPSTAKGNVTFDEFAPKNLTSHKTNATHKASWWYIAYTPNTPTHQAIANIMKQNNAGMKDVIGFASEDDLLSFFDSSNVNVSHTLAGVVFDLGSSTLKYKLRFPYKSRYDDIGTAVGSTDYWKTSYTYPTTTTTGPREEDENSGGAPGYDREGFLYLQSNVDCALYYYKLGGTAGSCSPGFTDIVNIVFRRTPYPSYQEDNFLSAVQPQLPILIILGFLFFIVDITKSIVYEKEKKLKESLRMLGISSLTHWVAWFITYFILLTIAVLLMLLFFCVPFPSGAILPNTNPLVLFIFLEVYICTVIVFGFLVSVIFQSANAAAAAAGVFFFLTYIPYIFLNSNYSTLSANTLVACCIFPNVGVSLGLRVIGSFETQGYGLQWNNVASGTNPDDSFTVGMIFGMFVIDFFLFLFISLYVEQVSPGDYGVPRPWYFLCTKSFCCSCSSCCKKKLGQVTPYPNGIDNLTEGADNFFQEEPMNAVAGIEIHNLRKVFGKDKQERVAVKGMNLNMYRGNITVLLGHNGAGKTTTMSMLTGFLPPSSGTAYINGYDIRTDFDSIRKSLGLCPQHDILFDKLTVKEHLYMFAKLKGMSNHVDEAVEAMTKRVNLLKKSDTLAEKLSGGMRRRLSIGMSLIGDSAIVILDEPTSGLDPDARRELWTLLQEERANRTMLLTTHFMDEAEILGDRIAIMADGSLLCCGSPLYLKNCYGADYHLTLVKSKDCNVDNILNVVKEFVPGYRMESNVTDELSILLPASSSGGFVNLFSKLEKQQTELGVRSYGVSITTMEEVFLKAESYREIHQAEREELQRNELKDDKEPLQEEVHITSHAQISMKKASDFKPRNTGARLQLQQFSALMRKRWLVFLRHVSLSVAQMLVPVAFVILGLIVMKVSPRAKDSPELALNLNSFEKVVMTYEKVGFTQDSPIVSAFVNLINTRANTETVDRTNLSPAYVNYLIQKGQDELYYYTREYLVGAQFENSSTSQLKWTAYFNNEPYHVPGILQNYISNALLQANGLGQYAIETVNHPLPMSVTDEVDSKVQKQGLAFALGTNMIFGLAFLISSFVSPVIRERISRAKQLQYLSGCTPSMYWFSCSIWDIINFILPTILIIVALVAFQETAYIADGRFMLVFLLLLLFALSSIPQTYLLSFLFDTPSDGLTGLIRYNVFIGTVSYIAANVLLIPSLNLVSAGEALEMLFFILLPQFCMAQGIYYMYINYVNLDVCGSDKVQLYCQFNATFTCCSDCSSDCLKYTSNYLSWESYGIGKSLVFLSIQAVICYFILFVLETSAFGSFLSCFTKCGNQQSKEKDEFDLTDVEDSDVAEERQMVIHSDIDSLKKEKCLILRDVCKTFGTFRAVDSLTCSVSAGNCFGLLGVNGAGKTTTFNMLTGDLLPTAGEFYVNGYSMSSQCREAQATLGYCPQFDAIIEEMSAREQLTFYCKLHGLHSDDIPDEVNRLLQMLNLKMYADTRSGDYSGGTKRKLNTAIALVGSPPLVCLDEPTTGMDPASRRQLWNTLTEYRNAGNTLVLTSHSMEECEALCTQVVIMVNGRFQCLGSTQHLKNKFAEGYTVLVQIVYPSEEEGEKFAAELLNFVEKELGSCNVKDRHQGHIHLYFVKSKDLTWSRLFSVFENNRSRLRIEHYCVSQTSLEQVFLGFARNQIPPREAPGCCSRLKCCCSKKKGKAYDDDTAVDNDDEAKDSRIRHKGDPLL